MDTNADFLTIIRNGYMAKKDVVSAALSKSKEELAKILKSEAFIADYEIVEDKPVKKIVVTLRYFDKNLPAITGIKTISKPSVRIYAGHKDIPQTMSGAGITIVSTSAGLLTDKAAKEKHLGGEVICQVW